MKNYLIGLVTGTLLTLFYQDYIAPDTTQSEYDAYRHCLQAAGQYRCQMTPQDFVRYYELKSLLEGVTKSQ